MKNKKTKNNKSVYIFVIEISSSSDNEVQFLKLNLDSNYKRLTTETTITNHYDDQNTV